jgi:hypothetical protein
MTTLRALSPEHAFDAVQLLSHPWEAVFASAMPSGLDSSLPPSLLHESTSMVLSDAAIAAAKELGWWDRYLLLFKNTLLFVHSTIDGPLRSAGWDQTWGVSIFLFTASTFRSCDRRPSRVTLGRFDSQLL